MSERRHSKDEIYAVLQRIDGYVGYMKTLVQGRLEETRDDYDSSDYKSLYMDGLDEIADEARDLLRAMQDHLR